TGKVMLAILSVPVRDPGPGFAATVYETVPLPVPPPTEPGSMAIQESLLTTVQAQPLPVVTCTVPAPALDVKFLWSGLSEKLHPGEVAALVALMVLQASSKLADVMIV